ncbi:MAG TPA: hypothetical protein VG934_03310 [Candidatus Paceibacterota bacterium]|nr:hypothetical protein [Candidatus Paceibacterota bacterium]
MDELEISGKRYISTRFAAKLHKYHADYIGQLIRGKKVPGQKVGRAWYVDAKALDAYFKGEAKSPARPRTILSIERVEPRVAARTIVQEEELVEAPEEEAPEGIEEPAREAAGAMADFEEEQRQSDEREEITPRTVHAAIEPEPARAPEPMQSFRRPLQIERHDEAGQEAVGEEQPQSVFETIAEELREEESVRESIRIPIRHSSAHAPSHLMYVDEMEAAIPTLTKKGNRSGLAPVTRMPRSQEEREDMEEDTGMAPRSAVLVPVIGVVVAGALVFGFVMLSSVFVNSTTIVDTGNASNAATALQAQP